MVKEISKSIGGCSYMRKQFVKFKDLLKRVKNAVFVKLAIKLSANILEGYSQQLIEVERGIRELRDALPQEEKIAKMAELSKKISKEDLRDFSAFITKISNDDIVKITTLAEVTKEFEARDAKSISRFIKKFSKEELEKTAILAETERAIQEKGFLPWRRRKGQYRKKMQKLFLSFSATRQKRIWR
jgi:hypothetical protein